MTTTPLPIGTVIRLNSDPGEDWDARVGTEYVVTAHVPHDESDNDPPADCYELDPAPGQGYWSSGEYAPYSADLTVVRTPAEQQERMRMPDGEELAAAVQSGLHSIFGEDFEVYESTVLKQAPPKGEPSVEGPHGFIYGVEFYARRRNGVSFGATLRLTSLWGTDD